MNMSTRRTESTPRRLKNYTSSASLSSILEAIRLELVRHQARRITFDYDGNGEVEALSFVLQVGEQLYTFRLPARYEAVERLLPESYKGSHMALPKGPALHAQARRTAWAILRDWIAAQMALIDTEMVKMEEVFLPYLLLDDGQTSYFEAFERYRALPELPAPKSNQFTITEER